MVLSKGRKKKGLILAAVIASGIGVVWVAHEKWDSGSHLSKGRVLAGAREVPLGHGDPWYGGKPSLPVRVVSDVEGAIPPGDWIPVKLTIRADVECQSISSRVRGVDALEVVSVDQTQECRSGASLSHEVRVRILPEGAGVLAVDLEVQTPEGTRQVTRAVSFQAESITPTQPPSAE